MSTTWVHLPLDLPALAPLTGEPKIDDVSSRPGQRSPSASRRRASTLVVHGAGVAVHRHHGQRRDHRLCGAEDGRPAAARCGDEALPDDAERLIRGDGSSSHEGIFDLETGEFLRQSTQQGYRWDSCWSRGLAWAIYGFTSAYQSTRDARFLETAEACADYYILETPATACR